MNRTLAILFGIALPALASGTTGAALQAPARHPGLAEYDGVYEYHGTTRLVIVSTNDMLFAVIDEAKYPLKPLGTDTFRNATGDIIPFRRSGDGGVSGLVERGTFFARLSAAVDPAIVAAVRATPRPLGPDGRPMPHEYRPPADLDDGLAVGEVSQAGLERGLVARLVDRVVNGTYPDVHGILVYRGGRLVIEEYFYEYDRDRPHQMRSASKSVVSALVGIAIDRGALAGDGELVLKRLEYESYANPDARKAQLTLRDLLTMRSGLACNDWDAGSPGNESRVYQSQDWVKFVLDLPMLEAPGAHGQYCSGNVAVAGRMVERATGMALPAFAEQHLFTPLGIAARDVKWNYTLSSSNASTFAQLYLRPRDMLKLGILYSHQGAWNGRQIVSRDWVARSMNRWSTVGDQEYGYFWWHQWTDVSTPAGPKRVEMVVATGNGGQKIYLVPSLDLIVVMTGGNYNSQSPAMRIMSTELLPPMVTANASPR